MAFDVKKLKWDRPMKVLGERRDQPVDRGAFGIKRGEMWLVENEGLPIAVGPNLLAKGVPTWVERRCVELYVVKGRVKLLRAYDPQAAPEKAEKPVDVVVAEATAVDDGGEILPPDPAVLAEHVPDTGEEIEPPTDEDLEKLWEETGISLSPAAYLSKYGKRGKEETVSLAEKIVASGGGGE